MTVGPSPVKFAPSAPRPPTPSKEIAAPDEAALAATFERLRKRVVFQTWAVAGLAILLVGLLPFAQPVHNYYAMKPDKTGMRMVGLNIPNMTNRAILSWATTSITEVMTMGFGDMGVRLPKQRIRFTKNGWDIYNKAFIKQKIGEAFKQYQLVLTTVPSNTPVIVRQGVNPEEVYQWVVQMPVIMTYATNNNVMNKKRATVTLTIVRVAAEENPFGIAIQSWELF